MTVRERIHAEIDAMPEDSLEQLLNVVRSIGPVAHGPERKEHIPERLMRIRIDAPPDFSENFELYASGEKRLDDAR